MNVAGWCERDEGTSTRGYKLATWRTLLDTAGRLTQLQKGPLQPPEMELCRELLRTRGALRAGDLVLEERGFLDGESLSYRKRQRRVDVLLPLKSNRPASGEAVALAELAQTWQRHPARSAPQIAVVSGVDQVWDECGVPLNAGVIRFSNARRAGAGLDRAGDD